jgi:hypothetical protein
MTSISIDLDYQRAAPSNVPGRRQNGEDGVETGRGISSFSASLSCQQSLRDAEKRG